MKIYTNMILHTNMMKIYTNMILHTNMIWYILIWFSILIFDIIGWFDISCDEHLFLRPIYPYIFDICFWIPGIHVYLSTRYLWVSVDQISMSICDFFLPEGKAVSKFLIAIPVLVIFLKSLLTTILVGSIKGIGNYTGE